MTGALRLGTRGSTLAVTQSQWVADRISETSGRAIELVRIESAGDVHTGSLAGMGGTGVFATALRDALLRRECDLVVHSLKDLPTAPTDDLRVAAIPERESARDGLCSSIADSMQSLPEGARVGTGSPRRAAQLLRARPDLRVLDIRGNVDTRIAKVRSGEYDAIVLAEAGMRRIGRASELVEVFSLEHTPTAAGQGALAVEIREDDAALQALLDDITDVAAMRRALLERKVLGSLEAGCAAPIGVSVADEHLIAEVYSLDGQQAIRVQRPLGSIANDDVLVAELVRELLQQGAARIAPLSPGGTDRA